MHFISFATRLINSIIQEYEFRFYLSYDIKIILKSYFGVKKFRLCHMHDVKSVVS